MTEPLRVLKAADLEERPPDRRWLIDGLWAEQAVGVIGGEPKSMKSFLALDCAVAVATGKGAVRRFAVNDPGPVLLYAAEDAAHVVKARLQGIARAAGTDLEDLAVFVITALGLRLDTDLDRLRLQEAVDRIRPRLLVLDPFVRLHRIDENQAQDVVPILAYLRGLQQAYGTSVMLVHHARKGASAARGGQALRGSSELHAWGDSNLYLRRKGKRLELQAEHRAADGIDGLRLELRDHHDHGPALAVVERDDQVVADDGEDETVADRVQRALEDAGTPVTVRELRGRLRIRTATLCDALAALVDSGKVKKRHDGYLAVVP